MGAGLAGRISGDTTLSHPPEIRKSHYEIQHSMQIRKLLFTENLTAHVLAQMRRWEKQVSSLYRLSRKSCHHFTFADTETCRVRFVTWPPEARQKKRITPTPRLPMSVSFMEVIQVLSSAHKPGCSGNNFITIRCWVLWTIVDNDREIFVNFKFI